MKFSHMLLLCAAAIFGLTSCAKQETSEFSCSHNHDHQSHDHSAHDHEGHNHAGHAHTSNPETKPETHEHGDDVIELCPSVAERFGVKTAKVEMQPFGSVVKVSGIISASAEGDAVVAAPTSGIVTIVNGINEGTEVRAGSIIATVKSTGVTGGDSNRAAKAELDAARAEFERVEPLYADRLVTLAQYNAAKAAYERAQAAYSESAATGRAATSISGVVTSLSVKSGQYVEVGTPIATVAAATNLTLHADLPSKYYGFLSEIKDARIVVPYSDKVITLSDLNARRVNDSNASSGASAGYIPVVFSFKNDGSLVPGTAVEVYLVGAGNRQALIVPRTAITEQQGNHFVFEQLDSDCYCKVQVTLGGNDGENVEITAGLKGGEVIVTAGVTTVRLAAAGGAVPAGHSHSH